LQGQFAVTFLARFRQPKQEPTQTKHEINGGENANKDAAVLSEEGNGSPVVVCILNALRGLPTDEDLRKTYHWDNRRNVASELELHAREKRLARLRRLWRAQWYSTMQLLVPAGTESSKTKDRVTRQQSQTVFAMIQGHRFLWWHSTYEFDHGEAALGRIFLQGHAGLATPSPLELRCMDKEVASRCVCIFGRGVGRQERITLIAPTLDVKTSLENGILFATSSDKND
jgi:hypothetical protein